MLKIIHIPLDERPCNYDFPKNIFEGEEFNIVRVPFEYMGLKKKPGNIEKIQEFFLNEAKDAYAAIISIDTLIYGGIVPSRLHYFTIEEVTKRLDIIKEIKKINPTIKLYAYNLVMRCPHYDDDDEEPFYYQHTDELIQDPCRIHLEVYLQLTKPEVLDRIHPELQSLHQPSFLGEFLHNV